MGRGKDRAIRQLSERNGLSPKQQRKLWAKVSALKYVLKEKGILLEEDLVEISRVEIAMERDIEKKHKEKLEKKDI
jgi:hypothetical protein